MHTILGIETSCDETAAAIVQGTTSPLSGTILSNVVYSQIDDHAKFGGVVPEIAARAHVEKLDTIIAQAMTQADVSWDEIDAIATTSGPGLIGGLIVGVMTGKTIAHVKQKPYFAINHLEGHALTARLTNRLPFPYLLLLVSGGHTQIVLVRGLDNYERWASTIDDALGEAFDKTAKLLGLGFPGGPELEKWAEKGNPHRFKLPRPLYGLPEPNFSFSGLKTALREQAEKLTPLTNEDIHDLSASFQHALIQSLIERIEKALPLVKRHIPAEGSLNFVVAGGVAANKVLRAALAEFAKSHDIDLTIPPASLCTDNAAMIAWAGAEMLNAGTSHPLSFAARSRWPLDEHAEPLIGSGKAGAKA